MLRQSLLLLLAMGRIRIGRNGAGYGELRLVSGLFVESDHTGRLGGIGQPQVYSFNLLLDFGFGFKICFGGCGIPLSDGRRGRLDPVMVSGLGYCARRGSVWTSYRAVGPDTDTLRDRLLLAVVTLDV